MSPVRARRDPGLVDVRVLKLREGTFLPADVTLLNRGLKIGAGARGSREPTPGLHATIGSLLNHTLGPGAGKHRPARSTNLSKHYDSRGIVEITVIIGIWNMTNRISQSLRLPLEPWREDVLKSCFSETDGNIPIGGRRDAS